uniref:Uncharacterized protein n=1 Tax=uncultured prokaryote TaxID=198431 RepID=A0A0H5Q694_9ZZZZ|nr:hypothetical protein [uncultured prokaryote]
MKPRHDYAGMIATDDCLWVYVGITVGTSTRTFRVKVPWDEFTKADFLHHIDKAVRKRIMDVWSGPAWEDQRLPGID